MFYKALLIILEILAFISMGFFSDFNKLESNKQYKKVILWRLACIIPLVIFALIQFVTVRTTHSLIILLLIILTFFADIVLSKNKTFGGILFLFFHLINIFSLTSSIFKLEYISFLIVSIVLIGIFFILNYKKFESLNKNSKLISIFFFLYIPLQVFGIYAFYLYTRIDLVVGFFTMIGAALFLMCDIQVLAQIIAKNNHEKYNDNLHIIINNIFYYTALMCFIFSTLV